MSKIIKLIYWFFASIFALFGLIGFKDHRLNSLPSFIAMLGLYSVTALAIKFFEIEFKSQIKMKSYLKLYMLAGILIFCISAFYFTLRIHETSIWNDEYLQSAVSTSEGDIAELSAQHFQPPLYFLVTSLSLKTFGLTETALRAPSIVFMALACCILFLSLLDFTKNIGISIFGLLCFVSNEYIREYSVEGRNYALSVLLTISTLYFFVKFWQKGFNSYKKEIFSSLILYFLSVNVHSHFFVFSLFAGFILFSNQLSRERIRKLAPLLFIVGFSFMYFSSIKNQLSYSSNPTYDFKHFFERFINNFNLFIQIFGDLSGSKILVLATFVSIFYGLLFLKDQLVKKYCLTLSVFLLSTLLLYSTQTITVFLRYFLLAFPLSIVCICLVLQSPLKRKGLLKKFLPTINLLPAFFLFQQPNFNKDHLVHLDWKGLYKELSKSSKENSLAYISPVFGNLIFSNEALIASEFYPQPNVKIQTPSNLITEHAYAYTIYNDINSNLNPSEIYFVHVIPGSAFEFDSKKFEKDDIAIIHLRDFYILKIENNTNFISTLLRFFRSLENQVPEEIEFRNIYQTILQIHLSQNNCSEVAKYYTLLQKIYLKRKLIYADTHAYSACKNYIELAN